MKRALILIISVYFFSCTGSGGHISELEPVLIIDLKNRINNNSTKIESLEASGNISFDSPDNSGTAWLELKIKKPDTVYIKLEGPFGISIANALITRSSFIYYNVQENKVIKGSSSAFNIGAVLRIKVTFDELINGFTGSFIISESDNDSANAEIEKNSYIINNHKEAAVEKYYIEPVMYRLKSYNVFNANKEPLIEVDYGDYVEENSNTGMLNFPQSVKIKNPVNKQVVYIEYINKEINKKNLSFKLKIPGSARVIEWE